jgi:hypothetical protein
MFFPVEWMRRLEPVPPYGDLERGFRQEVADPLWMLARQWQLGEHAGEDAGSPAGVTMSVSHVPIEPLDGLDPTRLPAEAIIEGSAEDWWTVGRRIRVGRAVAGSLTAAQRRQVAFRSPLPAPYGNAFEGDVDGRQAWRRKLIPADHPALKGLRPRRRDHWDSSRLRYDADLRAGPSKLTVRGHAGGDVDWYTADANRPIGRRQHAAEVEVIPMRLQYPGAPLPRVWQIEDHAVDIGGYPPDRSHLATALLIELVTDHAGDWFLAPVPSPFGRSRAPGMGVVVTLAEVKVRSSFDEVHSLEVPPGVGDDAGGPDEPQGPWSLFRTRGLGRSSLVLWPTAATPVTGPVLDEIAFGVDEDANLMWAVEERVDGVPRTGGVEARQALADGTSTGTRDFAWRPTTTLPPHWYPYRGVPVNRPEAFEQGVVADFSTGTPKPRPAPASDLIRSTPRKGHLLDLHAVTYQGLRLERRYILARCTDGSPALWRQRRTVPLLGPPASHLRFDVFRETPPKT